ncbi:MULTISPECIES: VWA domain-containing protein [unclassified Aureispira]|uniref:vWA domain-containing protein n=1 Tax=unclassified Aureispira TaxID=2649989 RepID=UPI000695B40A|nr:MULTISPECIES: VWA domain-containing protein [unclassified Aureispira]WMX13435.1 VWA domain-containing protein [Aureispira sp. CCB-E]
MSYFQGETPDNYEQKCLCTLVLDTSGSMSGAAIRELNRGLQEFYAAIEEDLIAANRLEVGIITFGSSIKTIQDPALIDNFDMPTLTVAGTTRLVDAVREAMRKTEQRKQWYKETGQPYYRPIIVLITDGEPDRDQDVKGLSSEIQSAVDSKKFTFWGLGVKGFNQHVLNEICPNSAPAIPLAGYKFAEFFKWLSNSIGIITKSKEGDSIELPPVSDWAQMKF